MQFVKCHAIFKRNERFASSFARFYFYFRIRMIGSL